MPNINLRLTEEEHAALREWAHGSRRSIQREVIFRLFTERSEVDAPSRTGAAEPNHGGAGEPTVAKRFNSAHAVPESDTHFKPDFK